MNCEQVERRLSEYLDKSLDPAHSQAVESHLSSCDRCRTEANLLAECIRRVAALSEVEPPIGFAQRVIAHVKEIETKPSFWESLFLPFKLNVPIQATVLVLIGIITIYIVEQEPHRKLITPPQHRFAVVVQDEQSPRDSAINDDSDAFKEKTHPDQEGAAKTMETPAVESGQERGTAVSPRGEVELSQSGRAEEDVFAPNPTPAPEFSASPELAPRVATEPNMIQPEASRIPAGIAKSPQNPKVTPTIPVVSDSKGRAMPQAHTAPVPRDLLEMMRAGAPGPPPLASELQRLSAAPDIELIVRRRPHSSKPSVRESGPLQKSAAGGSVVGEQTGAGSIDHLLSTLPESATRQTIWLSIPQNQYERVKKDLSALGTIESESRNVSASAPAADGQLRIMVIILTADEPGADRPARVPSRGGPNR